MSSLMQMIQFLQTECSAPLREQILALMRREWPQAFEGIEGEPPWPDNPATRPTSFVLLEENTVVCHVAVPWKYIQHAGETYKASGLSEVMTHPAYRQRGLGLQLVKAVTSFIMHNGSDIGLFTCQPALIPFYTRGGWEYSPNTNLIGGTREKPFRSDSLGLATMMRFFSARAQQRRALFERADIYLELGEKMLW